jgi:agmatinase
MEPSQAGPRSVARYDWEPSYAGIQTFLKLPLCLTPEDLDAGGIDVAIGGIPWDGTNTARAGTHLGPQGIRRCDNAWSPPLNRPSQWVRVDPVEHLTMADYGDAQVVPGNPPATGENIRRFVGEILGAGAMPILLGGDHWITWPIVSAFADHYGQGKVAVVHFDAHTDTAIPEPGTVGNHGTAVRQLIESGAVEARNFIQLGIRGNWPDPTVTAWMEEQGIRTHYMAEIVHRGFAAVLDDVIAEAREAEHVFITYDIDSVDPAFAPATGSPEPGGLTSLQAMRAVRRIAHEVGIVGMDLVEVSPPYDVGNNITALLGHRLVLEALTGTAMRRAGITEANYLDPRAANGPRGQ